MRPLQACLRCGSLDLHMQTLQDGLAADGGERLKWVCSRCDWQGTPIEFASRPRYEAFLEALRGPDGVQPSP